MQARLADAGIDTVWFGVAAELNEHFGTLLVQIGSPEYLNELGIEL